MGVSSFAESPLDGYLQFPVWETSVNNVRESCHTDLSPWGKFSEL